MVNPQIVPPGQNGPSSFKSAHVPPTMPPNMPPNVPGGRPPNVPGGRPPNMPGGKSSNASGAAKAPGMKAKKQGLGDMLFAPVVGFSKGMEWLTNSKGGLPYVFHCAAAFCCLLSAEGLYKALPQVELAATGVSTISSNNRAFIPKFGIEDGARISNFIDLGGLANNVQAYVPGVFPLTKTTPRTLKPMAATDPVFYVAVGVSVLVAGIEAKALRSVGNSIQDRIDRAQRLNQYRTPDISPDAIALAKVRGAEAKGAGMGRYAMSGAVIVGAYVFDISMFAASIGTGNTAFLPLLLNGGASVFGAELFWALAMNGED